MNQPGLRERKKQKTRWAIQDHALRLFGEQGYEATTVDQIAAAAEISPSTFFRYFRTKEDLVVEDEYDALLTAGLRDMPADLSLLAALRAATSRAFAGMGEHDWDKLRERTRLIQRNPALRARSAENMFATVGLVAAGVAQRTGLPDDDFRVRCFSGAVVGALVQAVEAWMADDMTAPLPPFVDDALAFLESGLSF